MKRDVDLILAQARQVELEDELVFRLVHVELGHETLADVATTCDGDCEEFLEVVEQCGGSVERHVIDVVAVACELCGCAEVMRKEGRRGDALK